MPCTLDNSEVESGLETSKAIESESEHRTLSTTWSTSTTTIAETAFLKSIQTADHQKVAPPFSKDKALDRWVGR